MDIIIYNEEKHIRTDIYLSEKIDKSRSYIQKLIKNGDITVNSKIIRPGYKLSLGDEINVDIPLVNLDIEPENIELDIIYEDDDIAVINKDPGISVHPAFEGEKGTLVSALLYKLDSLSTINGVFRPGIVHRLDKNTSGIMVIAKNDNAHQSLSKQFEKRMIKKHYLAVLKGMLKIDKGRIELPIRRDHNNRKKMSVNAMGKKSVTLYETLFKNKYYSVVNINLLTGRTHQIRVHFSYLGFPVEGDEVYGRVNSKSAKRQLLHASKLSFIHPVKNSRMYFYAPIIKDISEFIKSKFSENEVNKVNEWLSIRQ